MSMRGRKKSSTRRSTSNEAQNSVECSSSGTSRKRKGRKSESPPATKRSKNICAVCLDELSKDIMATPCAHVFCLLCLETALEYSLKCPLCRAPIEDDTRPPQGSPTSNSETDEEGAREQESPGRPSSSQ
ncbi:E3 ubiquitin-protein ligase RING1-like [Cimex lectularius]|uniref:RING-type domain-containing protein n=1 Tax=Cimex lectularius TaxID=79782 RepID=A0A8I6RPZ4_CIMLE|nr:E3 ubiquitin-protein ligase RING1-like [Cimex lectularius]